MFKVTGPRSKVGSSSDHDIAQLDDGSNICAKFELLSVYGYREKFGKGLFATFGKMTLPED